MSTTFVIKWNADNTYLKFKNEWQWVKDITHADEFENVNEIEYFVQKKANHWNSSQFAVKPYSIQRVQPVTENTSKFVVRWISDNTYMCGERLTNVVWDKFITESKQFDSKEEAEKFLTHTDGTRWWSGAPGCSQISIEEIHILNLKKDLNNV